MKRTSDALSPRLPDRSTSPHPTPVPWPDASTSPELLQQTIWQAMSDCDTDRLRAALAVQPEQTLLLTLHDRWGPMHLQTLVNALPRNNTRLELALQGRFPVGTPPEMAADLLMHPGLHTLQLQEVHLTRDQYTALLDAARQGRSTLRSLCWSNWSSQIFDERLVELIGLLGDLQSLELRIVGSDTDGVPVGQDGQCALLAALRHKQLEQLTLLNFTDALYWLAPDPSGDVPPPWRSLSLDLVDLTLLAAEAEEDVESLGHLLTECANNPHLQSLELEGIRLGSESCDRPDQLLQLWQGDRQSSSLANVAVALRLRQLPLGLSLTTCGTVAMQALLCVLSGIKPDRIAPDGEGIVHAAVPPVHCVRQLALKAHRRPVDPEGEPTQGQTDSQADARTGSQPHPQDRDLLSLARLATAHVTTFQGLDTLSIEVLPPERDGLWMDDSDASTSTSDAEDPDPGDSDLARLGHAMADEPEAPAPAELSTAGRRALADLSDTLCRLPLTGLHFDGHWLNPLPDELQACLRVTRERSMYRDLQYKAAACCIDWPIPGRTLPREVGLHVLAHTGDQRAAMRHAARIPMLNSTSLGRFVDRYNLDVSANNVQKPGPAEHMPQHPLTGLSRLIQQRISADEASDLP